MSKKNSCTLVPKVRGTGKPSKLYTGLNDNPNLKNDRLTVNYIYASYLQLGVADAMDVLGYKRDSNGEHYANDVYEYFDITQLRRERADINTLKQEAGVIDSTGNIIKYSSSLEALQKVNDYNNTAKGYVASVHKNGDYFIISIQEKNALSLHVQGDMNLLQENYDIAKNIIDAKMGDGFFELLLSSFPKNFFVTALSSNLTWLLSVVSVRNNVLMQSDIETILLFASDSLKARLESKYGDLKAAAEALYLHYKGTVLSNSDLILLESSLDTGRNIINKLGIENIKAQLKQSFEYDDLSYSIKETLDELQEEYKINDNKIKTITLKINTLSDAASKAAALLHRRLRQLERQKEGANDIEKQAIKSTIQKLLSSVESNREYSSILDFLNEVSLQFEALSQLFNNIGEQKEDEFTTIQNSCNNIISIESILYTYKQLLQELKYSPDVLIDFNSLDIDTQNTIIEQSGDLLEQLHKLELRLTTVKKSVFTKILTLYFGDLLPDGRDMETLTEMALADSTIWDHLYSWSRVSNPIVALMGKITRDALDKRTHLMFEYQKRIQVCEDKLKKAGTKDTKWMYTEDGYIVSKYDWKQYHEKRNKEWGRLKKLGLSLFEIEDNMAIWEETHTQEIIVDEVSGRTERVPIYEIDDAEVLDFLDENLFSSEAVAKREYYKEIMQIKGELGTLLPSYAQHHFLPPQVRRELTDTEFKHWLKAAWAGLTNIFHRENDEEFLKKNALYDDENMKYINSDASYDGTVRRSIPIFYVKKLQKQDELLKNFSGAMSFLMKTSVNYHCMNEVLDMITLMGDIASNLSINNITDKGTSAEIIENENVTVVNKLWKKASNTRTTAIIEGFIDREFFGVKLVNQGKWAKAVKILLLYASIKGLSTNVLGAISNINAGEYQILVEAIGSQHFNLADWVGAQALLFGDKVLKQPGHIVDFFTNNTNVYNTLIGNLFDPQVDAFEKMGSQRYKRGLLRHVLGNINTHALYGIGENLLHYTVMYAKLLNVKVLLNGKKISLYNAFEKIVMEEDSSVKTLKFKDGVTTLDGQLLTDIHGDFVQKVRGEIRTANQLCHGSMSEEDKGLIGRYLWGRCLMQMRQWMVEHLSRRYRGLHYDGSTDTWTEGYYVTAWKWLVGDMDRSINLESRRNWFRIRKANALIKDYKNELEKRRNGTSTMSETAFKAFQHKAKLAENRKANMIKFTADIIMTTLLLILAYGILTPPEETEGESYIFRLFHYFSRRSATEALAATPAGALLESYSVYKNSAYVASTVNGLAYPIYGLLLDYDKWYESGPHAGEDKYRVKVLKKALPFYNDYDKLIHLQDNSDIFDPFDPTYQLTR